MKRRLFALLLFCGIVLSCVSCQTAEEDGRPSVIATNFALYDFARAVCGDACRVTMLIAPGAESHDFEATLSDMAAIAESDLFLYVGGESEAWVTDIFNALGSDENSPQRLRALDWVTLLPETLPLGAEPEEEAHNHDHDHDHAVMDEHVWTAIPGAVTLLEKIAAAVTDLDGLTPDQMTRMQENTAAYRETLLQIHEDLHTTVASAKRNVILVADRFPFRYFTEEYGLTAYAAFSGCSSATEPSLATMNGLITAARNAALPAVFIIEFSDGRTARAVADETGAAILTLHSAHNVTAEDFNQGVTYADLMRRNLEALRIALN